MKFRKLHPLPPTNQEIQWIAKRYQQGIGTVYTGPADFLVVPTRCRAKKLRNHNPDSKLWAPALTTERDLNNLQGGRDWYIARASAETVRTPLSNLAAAVGIIHAISPPTMMDKGAFNGLMALLSRNLSMPVGHANTGLPAPNAWREIGAFIDRQNGPDLIGQLIFPTYGRELLPPLQNLPLHQWLSRFPQNRARQIVRELVDALIHKKRWADLTKFQTFVKREFGGAHVACLPCTGIFGPEGYCCPGCQSNSTCILAGEAQQNPRTICSPNETAHAITAPVLNSLTHLLSKGMDINHNITYAGNCSPEQLNQWATQFYQKGGVYNTYIQQQLFPKSANSNGPRLDLNDMMAQTRNPPALPKIKGSPLQPPLGKDWLYYMADLSACDQSHSIASFRVLYSMYKRMGADPFSGSLFSEIMQAWLNPTGTHRIGKHSDLGGSFEFKATHINASGRGDTSLLNLIVNALIMVLGFFLATMANEKGTPPTLASLANCETHDFQIFLKDFHMILLGDDSATVLPFSPNGLSREQFIQAAELVMAEANFTVKGKVLADITDFTFLGMRPVPTETVVNYNGEKVLAGLLVFAPVLGRRLPKHHVCMNPPLGRLRWLRGVAFAELLTSHFVPVISHINERVMELTNGVTIRLPREHIKWLPTLGARRLYYQTDDTLHWFFKNYPISPQQLENTVETIGAIPRLPWSLSDPTIDAIFLADLDRQ